MTLLSLGAKPIFYRLTHMKNGVKWGLTYHLVI